MLLIARPPQPLGGLQGRTHLRLRAPAGRAARPAVLRAPRASGSDGQEPSDLVGRVAEQMTKEPIAFLGGLAAGLLRLDMNEEPLRSWLTRTVEAAGVDPAEMGAAAAPRADVEEITIE